MFDQAWLVKAGSVTDRLAGKREDSYFRAAEIVVALVDGKTVVGRETMQVRSRSRAFQTKRGTVCRRPGFWLGLQ